MYRWLMGLPYRDRFDFARLRGCFEGEGGQGSGAGAGAGGDQGTGKGSGDDGSQNNQPFAVFPDEKSFMRRIDQASKQELKKLAESMGFESVEAFQAAAKTHKDAQDANKSELEKEKAAREKAETDKKEALEKANQRLINAEIKIAAQATGFVDPGDAVALIDRTGIAINDKEEITGVKEAVEALAKAKPHLVGKAGGGSVGSGSNPGAGGATDPVAAAKKMAEERNKGKQAAAGGYDPWATK